MDALSKIDPALAGPAMQLDLLEQLKHPDIRVRKVALETLRKLEPAVLEQQVPVLVAELENLNVRRRSAAVHALSTFQPEVLAKALVAQLEHSNVRLSKFAAEALIELEPATYKPHAPVLVGKLEHSDGYMRLAIMVALAKLDVKDLPSDGDAVKLPISWEWGDEVIKSCRESIRSIGVGGAAASGVERAHAPLPPSPRTCPNLPEPAHSLPLFSTSCSL